jgi:hypothetical protein
MVFCSDIDQIDIPPISSSLCPPNLAKLIQSCWSERSYERPSFEDIYQMFKDEKIVFENNQKDKNNYINDLFDFIDHDYYLDSPIFKHAEEKMDVFQTQYVQMGEPIKNPTYFFNKFCFSTPRSS